MSMINIGADSSTSTLTNIQEGDVQPNAVDLRLGKVLRIGEGPFEITDDYKVHRAGSTEMEVDQHGMWVLQPGRYEVVMDNIITIGEGESGFVITRSTLNRNGVYLTSGLYDSGYHGPMAAVMHVHCGVMKIAKGTRIGQMVMFESETSHLYDGTYGYGKAHDDAKYRG